MIETILLAVGEDDADRSDALVDQTLAVAEPTGATVVVAHVLSADEYEGEVRNYNDAIDRVGLDVRKGELTPETLARETDPIKGMIERLEDAGIDVDVRASVGDRASEVVRLAEEVDADNVVVGGRKRSPTGKAVFGDTAQRILLTAPCPVTYVQGD